jgi:hypothetical protein
MRSNGLTFANSRVDLEGSIDAQLWSPRLFHLFAADFRDRSMWPAISPGSTNDYFLMEGKQ